MRDRECGGGQINLIENENLDSRPSAEAGQALIVGGGVIGLASAWYLRERGWRVTVIDRGTIGGACSHGNCGLICPSHVLPLTEPGAINSAVRAMLTPNAPFRIRPRLSPALWGWLWQFARRCNHAAMIKAAHGIEALLASSMREYRRWIEVEGIECEWQQRGLLFAYLNHRAWKAYESTNALLTEQFNLPAQPLSAEEAIALEPALRPTIAGGWYHPHDAHLRPDVLMNSLRQRLVDRGVSFREQCSLIRLVGSGGTVQYAETEHGSIAADVFVLACGAWSPLLSDEIGCSIPIQPGKGYSMTMRRPTVCPSIPLIFPEHRVAVTPMKSGYRLGSIMEFAGYDASIQPRRLRLLRDGAAHYLQEPYCEPIEEVWQGWRPMTYDSLPIIDRTPRWGNAWLATGHSMLGVSMAPATGQLLAELIGEVSPHLDPQPYRLSRFG